MKKESFVNKEMYEGLIQHHMIKDKPKKKKYWYRQYIGECPVCGKNASWRERIYGEKPKDSTKIYIELSDYETYDHCIE